MSCRIKIQFMIYDVTFLFEFSCYFVLPLTPAGYKRGALCNYGVTKFNVAWNVGVNYIVISN